MLLKDKSCYNIYIERIGYKLKNRIKEIRKEKNLSQQEFGSMTGISRSHVANLEKGLVNCSDRVLDDICNKFKINKQWLKNGEGEKYQKDFEYDNLGVLIGSMFAENNDLRKKLTTVLLSLSIEELEVIEKIAKEIAK